MKDILSNLRAQAFTLEGFFAAVLILSSVVFALQATAITPLTSSTASQQIQNQEGSAAEGVLNSEIENNHLKPVLLAWDEEAADGVGCWAGTEEGNDLNPEDNPDGNSDTNGFCSYVDRTSNNSTDTGVPGKFGAALGEIYGGAERRTALNIDLYYYEPCPSAGGNCESTDDLQQIHQPLLSMGDPTNNSVTVQNQMTIYNDDPIYEYDNGQLEETNETVSTTSMYTTSGDEMEDISSGTNLYNIVTIEVTVWRI